MTFILHAWVFYQLQMIRTDDNTIETVVDVLSTHQPAPMRTKSTSSFGNGFPFAVFSSAIFLKWDWTLSAVERFLFKTDKKCTAPSQLTVTLQKGLSTARKFPAGCVHYDLRWVPCMKHRSFVWYLGASWHNRGLWRSFDSRWESNVLKKRNQKEFRSFRPNSPSKWNLHRTDNRLVGRWKCTDENGEYIMWLWTLWTFCSPFGTFSCCALTNCTYT